GSRDNREETAGRHQANPRLGGNREYGRAGIIESVGAKGIYIDWPERALRRRQCPRFVDQISKRHAPPPCPWILCTRHDDTRVVVQNLESESLICSEAQALCRNQKIDVALAQFMVQGLGLRHRKIKYNARKASGQPVDNARNKARGEKGSGSDPHFAGRGVAEEFNVPDTLPQFVKHGNAAFEQRGTVDRRLSAVTVTFKQAHAQRVLKVGDHL